MFDLHKLQIFLHVAQEGSFSAAAERLFITQSAVSQHIKELEASLGRTLFERGRRGVRLTPAGETLYRYAREIFALVARAETALTDVEQLPAGKVSLGATPGIANYLAPEWVQNFRRRYPKLTAAIQTGVTSEIIQAVLARRLDLGLLEGELDGYTDERLGWVGLAEIEQRVIVGSRHPWWNAEAVTLDALGGQTFVMRPLNSQSRIWVDQVLRQRGIEPAVGAEFDSPEAIKRAVMRGTCLTILPEYVTQQEVEAGLLRALPVRD
ncbi:MAG: LysR family transcriptional regulator, partial [Anaerolineae bacterium]|nr:LysR family transcriptional regulator [Anaerolineae bacterium]